MIDSASLGERVRRLRMATGLSQTDLSRQLGVSGNAVVSKLETGRLAPDEGLLNELADCLGCTTGYLSRSGFDGVSTKPWLRAYADASAKVVDRVLADNLLAHEFVDAVGLQPVPDSLPLMTGDANDDDAIEEFAGEVRTAAGVPEGGVVRNVIRASERVGVTVLPMESELGRHLGLSQRIDGRPIIRVAGPGRAGVPGDRQRFTVAHELGHLALHSELPPPRTPEEGKRLEKQAHRFAAAFLTPAAPLLDDWQASGSRVTLGALQKLKTTWGVAIKMLVTRFRHLNVIDDDHARSLYRQISARGWNRNEPVEVSTEGAVWFGKALSRAFPSKDLEESMHRAAGHHGLNFRYIAGWAMWDHGSSTVIRLEPNGSELSQTPAGHLAEVVHLTRNRDR
ncbi:XRE family transcriptional regulator [Tessaracoccus sp. OS52]|uniref:helix-turn-helix domain-containing protein n=1 Tax=Tessaracoccus sp. OS52 TaxID=2886691 RepID=UPI001D10C01A|nr:XRE family transcriptional regulator [Tessaracoccus sp. OS52]